MCSNTRASSCSARRGRQIALFHTPRGVLACNNRCPHEGYPLREGSLDERCILTCNWHNWKFDLRSGRNLYGGEGLRTYPVEVRDGEVWIDLVDPPVAERRVQILASLAEASEDNAYERMARELARLHRLGADPLDALREAIHRSFERMEFGWTHAYAGAADWLTLYDENKGDDETRLACVLESIAHIADDVLREPRHPFPDGVRPWDDEVFVAAVEDEDQDAAVAALRGGLAEGLGFADFERGLSRASLAHYNDFGHSLIYVTKAGRLIERLGSGVAEPLLLSLVRGLVFATREGSDSRVSRLREGSRAVGQRDERRRSGARRLARTGNRQGACACRRIECGVAVAPLPRPARRQCPQSPRLRRRTSGSGPHSHRRQRRLALLHARDHLRQRGFDCFAPGSPSCGRAPSCRWPVSAAAMRPIPPAMATVMASHGKWRTSMRFSRLRSRGSTTMAPASSSCRCTC